MRYYLSIIKSNEKIVRLYYDTCEALAECVWSVSDNPNVKAILIEKEYNNEKISQDS